MEIGRTFCFARQRVGSLMRWLFEIARPQTLYHTVDGQKSTSKLGCNRQILPLERFHGPYIMGPSSSVNDLRGAFAGSTNSALVHFRASLDVSWPLGVLITLD